MIPLFGALLTWGQAYTFFTLITAGKDVLVERTRDEEDRTYIMYSVCPYAFSPVLLSAIEDSERQAHSRERRNSTGRMQTQGWTLSHRT